MNGIKSIYCRAFQLCFRAALPLLPYREPEILDSMEELGRLLAEKGKNNTLIVTDKGISGLGLVKQLTDALEKSGIAYTVYDETIPNPTIHNVERAREQYLKNGCNAIIAFGGGSSIDCAKAAGARIAKPRQPVQKMRGLLKIHKKLPLLVAIPTTAGTGSETTLAAVITDAATHHKYPINDFSLIPRYAVLDYRVTTDLPKHITSTTGMDALTHAVEAYIGRSTTSHTRRMAEEAVGLIKAYLKRAYDDGTDTEAREQMLRAAYCAGIAFTQSYVGYVHGVAHSLGGRYGVPHGLANAVILPYFLDRYGKSCEKRLARLARACTVAPKDAEDHTAAQTFISWVREMNRSMNIPDKINGIKEEDIPQMAAHADKESNPLYPVPCLMDVKELASMYKLISSTETAFPKENERSGQQWKSALS
ncbi:MAG: iron-containing alcohol dehydrogenase [Lachnospiraceae bacterium]|jgi:alcohol dehydrogenase|nr:iron-containing alcohol dehydrogenase [Lachnospiraceae bacterium]